MDLHSEKLIHQYNYNDDYEVKYLCCTLDKKTLLAGSERGIHIYSLDTRVFEKTIHFYDDMDSI